jgi:hypothetical protein
MVNRAAPVLYGFEFFDCPLIIIDYSILNHLVNKRIYKLQTYYYNKAAE